MNASPSALRLGFAGTPQFAVPTLDALLASAHQVAAVFTQPDRPAGRGRALHSSPVKARALECDIPVHQPPSFRAAEPLEVLRGLGLDALVVVAYGLILPAAALDIPTHGCFNVHASLLPRWRGAAPIQRAILSGDKTTGVTIMRMAAGLDTGPVLATGEIPLPADDTAADLQNRLAPLGATLMGVTLSAIAAGRATERAQPQEGVTYAAKIDKAEALLDWREDATVIVRKVRAFNPWPVAQTHLDGTQLRIWAAAEGLPAGEAAAAGTVLAASEAGIEVACGRGTVRLLRLQLAGRKVLPAGEFIRGQRLAGRRFATE